MAQDPKWLQRVVECYSKDTEEIVSEHLLHSITLEELQALWGVSLDDPMVGVFDIDKNQAAFLQRCVDCHLDLNAYDYQLCAYTTDLEASKRAGGFMGRYPPPRELPGFPDTTRIRSKTLIDDE